jgi:hypothetical protein
MRPHMPFVRSLILVIHDNMIIGTNPIALACLMFTLDQTSPFLILCSHSPPLVSYP